MNSDPLQAAPASEPAPAVPPAAESAAPPPTETPPASASAAAASTDQNAPADAADKPRVLVGSQRAGGDAPSSASSGAEPRAASRGPVAGGRLVRSRLARGEDAEIEAALAGVSMDAVSKTAVAAPGAELETEKRYKAIVAGIHQDNVLLTIGANHQGVTPLKSFKKPPQPGDFLEVVIKSFSAEEGLYEVGVPGSAVDVADWTDLVVGAVVEARVTGANTGGLECVVNNIRGFIPASQIAVHRVENLSDFINQKLPCVVTEANAGRRNLVLSRRAVLEREQEAARKSFLETLQIGDVREGVIRSLRDFGAFVDLGGGVDGMIHISKMSWDRVQHPSEVFQEGQKVRVKVEKVDQQTGKIALSYRDLMEDPWQNIEQKYPVGSVARGVVSRLAQFGAFVKLEPGVEGLVHISELAHHRVFAVANVVKEGQEVEVKVMSVDRAAQRVGLSLKATQAKPEAPKTEPPPAEAEAPPEAEPPRQPKKNVPLKGGFDKPAGGDRFGLKW